MARNIFNDMEQRFDDLRRDLLGSRWNEPAGLLPGEIGMTPACDVCDNGNEYQVVLDVPGFDKKDIHVDIEDHGLRVWGSVTRESPPPTQKGQARNTYLRRERTAESFERYVTFPEEVGADGTRATYKNGVLDVTLPKVAPEKRRSKSIE